MLEVPVPAFRKKSARLTFGVGICDAPSVDPTTKKFYRSYSNWRGILDRCYYAPHQVRRPRYSGCTICDEWKQYSVFRDWFDANAREGFQMDKDILVPGNRVYGPDTCVFVPRYINQSVIRLDACGYQDNGHNVSVKAHVGGRSVRIATLTDREEATRIYRKVRADEIRKSAARAMECGDIALRVRDALFRIAADLEKRSF